MKFLLLLVIVVFAFWLLKTRGRAAPPPRRKDPPKDPQATTQMVACVHCGLHLPQADAVQDADGRAYCSPAHRLAGPR
jgi:uncharacterized protein